MPIRLLESKAHRNRSFWGTAVSTIGHTIVIAAAVFATAQARVEEPNVAQSIQWMSPSVAPLRVAAPVRSAERPSRAVLPDLSVPDRINLLTAPIEFTPTSPSVDQIPLAGTPADPGHAPDDGRRGDVSEPYFAEQVERQVSLRSGSAPPRYPGALRASGTEGEVVVAFVVDVTGRAELATLRVLRSDNVLFETSVRDALVNMRFAPAEIGGTKVRQLVQMPFVFRLSR